MKRFSLILSAVLFALSISANAFQIPTADVQARMKANKSLAAKTAVDGLKRAPQQTQTCSVEATEFAPGIGLIKFAAVNYAAYKDYFDYYVYVTQGGSTLGRKVFDYSDGETGITTAAILGDTLAPGNYDIYVQAVNGGSVFEQGQGTLTITNAATESIISISDVKAVNSQDLSTTTISWTQEGALPEGGFTLIQVYSSGELAYSSLTDPNYGQKAINSPVTISLPKDKDYFIYIYEFLSNATALSQYVAFAYAQHSVGVNPFTPVNLQAVIDGNEVTFTWASYKADSIPAMTQLIWYDEDTTQIDYELLKHTGDDAVGQTLTLTLDPETKYNWSVRPVAADYYYITQIQFGGEFTTGKDNKKPEISAVEVGKVTNTTIELLVDAEDNYSEADSLLITVKNGENVLLDKVAIDEVVVTGLTINTEYNFTVIAFDEAGNASDPFAVTAKTGNDTEAPVIAKAALKNCTDRRAYIKVDASDNVTDFADLVFVVTIQGVAEPLKLQANEDSVLIIFGLAPKTSYSLTVAATDEVGNTCAASAAIEFTTAEDTPVELKPTAALANYLGSNAYGYQFFQINLYGPKSAGWLPDLYFTIIAMQQTKISGTYTTTVGDLWTNSNYTYITPDAEVADAMEAMAVTSGQLKLTFTEYKVKNNVSMPAYDFEFSVVAEDGGTYFGSVKDVRLVTYNVQDQQEEIITGEGEIIDAIDNINAAVKATKTIENGMLIIEMNGVRYNVLGNVIR